MVEANAAWTVLPHGPVERLEDNLLRVEGSLPGMPLRRVMTVARRADGRVVVHNAIAMAPKAMAELEAFGTPSFIVVPNAFHRLDAPRFKQRFADAQVVCPPAAQAKVAKVVPVDATYETMPPDDDVTISTLAGTGGSEGVMVVRHGDGVSLVFNDLVFNMPHVTGAHGFVFKHVTGSSGGPKVTRVARWFLIKDKAAVATALRELADLPGLRRIIVSHHEVIDVDPAGVLRAVAATLG